MRANGGGGHRARTHARTQALSPPRPSHGAVVLPPPLPNATVLPAALQRGRPDPITPSPPFAPPPSTTPERAAPWPCIPGISDPTPLAPTQPRPDAPSRGGGERRERDMNHTPCSHRPTALPAPIAPGFSPLPSPPCPPGTAWPPPGRCFAAPRGPTLQGMGYSPTVGPATRGGQGVFLWPLCFPAAHTAPQRGN